MKINQRGLSNIKIETCNLKAIPYFCFFNSYERKTGVV